MNEQVWSLTGNDLIRYCTGTLGISPLQTSAFSALFASLDTQHQGVLSPKNVQLISLLSSSSLPNQALKQVWLSSICVNRAISLSSFIHMMVLITVAQMHLPPELNSIPSLLSSLAQQSPINRQQQPQSPQIHIPYPNLSVDWQTLERQAMQQQGGYAPTPLSSPVNNTSATPSSLSSTTTSLNSPQKQQQQRQQPSPQQPYFPVDPPSETELFRCIRAFDSADINKDGYISSNELAYFSKSGLSNEITLALVQLSDLDHDGILSPVEFAFCLLLHLRVRQTGVIPAQNTHGPLLMGLYQSMLIACTENLSLFPAYINGRITGPYMSQSPTASLQGGITGITSGGGGGMGGMGGMSSPTPLSIPLASVNETMPITPSHAAATTTRRGQRSSSIAPDTNSLVRPMGSSLGRVTGQPEMGTQSSLARITGQPSTPRTQQQQPQGGLRLGSSQQQQQPPVSAPAPIPSQSNSGNDNNQIDLFALMTSPPAAAVPSSSPTTTTTKPATSDLLNIDHHSTPQVATGSSQVTFDMFTTPINSPGVVPLAQQQQLSGQHDVYVRPPTATTAVPVGRPQSSLIPDPLSLEIQAKQAQISVLQQDKDKLDDKVLFTSIDHGDKQRRNDELTETVTTMAETNTQLQNKITEMEQHMAQLDSEYETLTLDIETLKNNEKKLTDEYNEKVAQYEIQKNNNIEAHRTIESLQSNIEQLNNQNNNITISLNEMHNFEETVILLEEQVNQHTDIYNKLQDELNHKQDEYNILQEKSRALDETSQQLEKNTCDINVHIDNINVSIQKHHDIIKKQQNTYHDLYRTYILRKQQLIDLQQQQQQQQSSLLSSSDSIQSSLHLINILDVLLGPLPDTYKNKNITTLSLTTPPPTTPNMINNSSLSIILPQSHPSTPLAVSMGGGGNTGTPTVGSTSSSSSSLEVYPEGEEESVTTTTTTTTTTNTTSQDTPLQHSTSSVSTSDDNDAIHTTTTTLPSSPQLEQTTEQPQSPEHQPETQSNMYIRPTTPEIAIDDSVFNAFSDFDDDDDADVDNNNNISSTPAVAGSISSPQQAPSPFDDAVFEPDFDNDPFDTGAGIVPVTVVPVNTVIVSQSVLDHDDNTTTVASSSVVDTTITPISTDDQDFAFNAAAFDFNDNTNNFDNIDDNNTDDTTPSSTIAVPIVAVDNDDADSPPSATEINSVHNTDIVETNDSNDNSNNNDNVGDNDDDAFTFAFPEQDQDESTQQQQEQSVSTEQSSHHVIIDSNTSHAEDEQHIDTPHSTHIMSNDTSHIISLIDDSDSDNNDDDHHHNNDNVTNYTSSTHDISKINNNNNNDEITASAIDSSQRSSSSIVIDNNTHQYQTKSLDSIDQHNQLQQHQQSQHVHLEPALIMNAENTGSINSNHDDADFDADFNFD